MPNMKYEEENEKKEHATHKEVATYEGGNEAKSMQRKNCNMWKRHKTILKQVMSIMILFWSSSHLSWYSS